MSTTPPPSATASPAAGPGHSALAEVALTASRSVRALGTAAGATRTLRSPHDDSVADLPWYVPRFGLPDRRTGTVRVVDLDPGLLEAPGTTAPYTAAATELARSGIHVYADVTKHAPSGDPLELWEHAARFGPGAVYAGMRSLAAAVLTAQACAGHPDYPDHLEALHHNWLVDRILNGTGLVAAAGPTDRHDLLPGLAFAVAGCSNLTEYPVTDAELRMRLWESLAGPGPDTKPLNAHLLAKRRVLLLDLADPFYQAHAHVMPTWSAAGPGPEEAVLAGLPGTLQLRIDAALNPRDRAVLHAYQAGAPSWTQAAADSSPGCADPAGLGERVRRLVRRFGQEEQRRSAARLAGAAHSGEVR